MTKQEIKDLVLAKIAGQGTQIDLGGALPAILNAIVDLIPEGGGAEPYIVQGATTETIGSVDVLVVSADEYARAKAAFLAGRVVFIPEIDSNAYQATAFSHDAIQDDESNPIEGLSLYVRSTGELANNSPIALVSE